MEHLNQPYSPEQNPMDLYGSLELEASGSRFLGRSIQKASGNITKYTIGVCFAVLFISAGFACLKSNSFSASEQGLGITSPYSKPSQRSMTPGAGKEPLSDAVEEERQASTDDSKNPDVLVVLGRPTCDSVTMKLMASKGAVVNPVSVQYSTDPLDSTTAAVSDWSPADGSWDGSSPLSDKSPQTLELSGIFSASTSYNYRVSYLGEAGQPMTSQDYSFSTCKQAGESFKVLMMTDTHYGDGDDWHEDRLDQGLNSMAAIVDQHDFLIDMGDTFMCEKVPQMCQQDLEGVHQWWFNTFARLAGNAPLFLGIGNHDGLAGYLMKEKNSGLVEPLTVLEAKKRFFALPNPSEDDTGFYTANSDSTSPTGTSGSPDDTYLQNYYAWQWGDALFVVLDPFWYTTELAPDDGWRFTLGLDQHTWLVQTMQASTATFKFVYMHNHLGGMWGPESKPGVYNGRGNCEWAQYFENGGMDEDGKYAFDKMRPDFIQASEGGGSLQEVMEAYGVTAYFHAHDHLSSFCNLQLDPTSNGVWQASVTKIDSRTYLEQAKLDKLEDRSLDTLDELPPLEKSPAEKGFTCKTDDAVITNSMNGWCDDGAGFVSLSITPDQVDIVLVDVDGKEMHRATFMADGTATPTPPGSG